MRRSSARASGAATRRNHSSIRDRSPASATGGTEVTSPVSGSTSRSPRGNRDGSTVPEGNSDTRTASPSTEATSPAAIAARTVPSSVIDPSSDFGRTPARKAASNAALASTASPRFSRDRPRQTCVPFSMPVASPDSSTPDSPGSIRATRSHGTTRSNRRPSDTTVARTPSPVAATRSTTSGVAPSRR
ncbi:MAG: hypothetical protein CMJ52_08755 [Planctomycetaceae bacterium]|nr:hypothetical protein [Planctomycetaceae bacterium]